MVSMLDGSNGLVAGVFVSALRGADGAASAWRYEIVVERFARDFEVAPAALKARLLATASA